MTDEKPADAADATVRLLADVLGGACPVGRLGRRVVPAVRRELHEHAAARTPASGCAPRPQMLRTWLQRPRSGAIETGAVIREADGIRVLAARLDLIAGSWRCTAVQTADPAPLPAAMRTREPRALDRRAA